MRNTEVIYVPPPFEERLPFFWSGMGEEVRRTARYRWDGLKRGTEEHLVWQLTLAGCGWIRIGSHAPVRLEAGSGFMARFPSDHCYYYRAGDPAWRFIWVSWTGPALRAIWESISPVPARVVTMDAAGATVGYVRSILKSRATQPSNSRNDAADAYRLLLEVTQATPRPVSRLPKARALLPKINCVLQQSPKLPIGKDGLATQLDLSRYQLYRSLKREMGVSPKEWALRQRLDRAFRLLRAGELPIAEVAVRVGMPDANYFTRFFRQRTGFTPRDWRKLFG